MVMSTMMISVKINYELKFTARWVLVPKRDKMAFPGEKLKSA
jgi:hypothetical protein